SVQVADETPGQVSTGLVYLNAIGDGSGGKSVMSQVIRWSAGVDGVPRARRVEYQNGEVATTSAVEYDFGPHNEITEVRSFNYDGSLRRRVTTEYLTDPQYEARHIFGLATKVLVYDGNSAVPVSRTDYFYDQFPLVTLPTPALQHSMLDWRRGNVTT